MGVLRGLLDSAAVTVTNILLTDTTTDDAEPCRFGNYSCNTA
jgi:hypothetical protein